VGDSRGAALRLSLLADFFIARLLGGNGAAVHRDQAAVGRTVDHPDAERAIDAGALLALNFAIGKRERFRRIPIALVHFDRTAHDFIGRRPDSEGRERRQQQHGEPGKHHSTRIDTAATHMLRESVRGYNSFAAR